MPVPVPVPVPDLRDARREIALSDLATTSIELNIAEGAGEFSLPDKQRFYRMAKRSATESSAIHPRRLDADQAGVQVTPGSGTGTGTGTGTGAGRQNAASPRSEAAC